MKLALFGAAAALAGVAAFRRRRRLGATSRKGPRTGAVEIDVVEINKRVEQALRTMTPCWSRKEGTYLRPIHEAILDPVMVRDARTGTKRRVQVAVMPLENPTGGGALATQIDKRGRLLQTVVLTPDADLCGKVPAWRSYIRSVLAHELAHAADPWLIEQARGRSRVKRTGPRRTVPGSRAYYNSPEEMIAHMAEVQDQLRRFGSQVDWSASPPEILRQSTRFQDIEPMLTPASRRRFLKMAARLKDQRSGVAGPRRVRRRSVTRS